MSSDVTVFISVFIAPDKRVYPHNIFCAPQPTGGGHIDFSVEPIGVVVTLSFLHNIL